MKKVYIIAEVGINHNGDIDKAKKLIDIAAAAGCDVVKFQKRNPDLCVPEDQKNIMYYLKYSSRDADIYSIERGYLDDDINYDIGYVCRIRRI